MQNYENFQKHEKYRKYRSGVGRLGKTPRYPIPIFNHPYNGGLDPLLLLLLLLLLPHRFSVPSQTLCSQCQKRKLTVAQ